jgi:predicted SpoU family rRNA methylase
LDRLFEGKELRKAFDHAKIRIIPQKRGKKTEKPVAPIKIS